MIRFECKAKLRKTFPSIRILVVMLILSSLPEPVAVQAQPTGPIQTVVKLPAEDIPPTPSPTRTPLPTLPPESIPTPLQDPMHDNSDGWTSLIAGLAMMLALIVIGIIAKRREKNNPTPE